MPFYLLENHEMRVVKIPDNEDHFYRSSLESTIVGMGMSPLNTYGVIKIEKRRGGGSESKLAKSKTKQIKERRK